MRRLKTIKSNSKIFSEYESKTRKILRVQGVLREDDGGWYAEESDETNVVDALSFTEAESRIVEEMKPFVGDKEMEVTAIKIASYKEAFFSDAASDDKFYKVRCNFITIDEKSGREKKTAVDYLVQATSVESARKNMEEAMSGTMIDYVIVSLVETNIIDVFDC